MAKAAKAKQNTITLPEKPGDTRTPGEALAGASIERAIGNALLTSEYGGRLFKNSLPLSDWAHGLHETIKAVQGGDLKNIEATLTGQVIALDAMFTSLAHRAIKAEYLQQAETFTRLAMKAQNQCRATAQTLATLKAPRQTVFADQANISHGPQQVNNGQAVPEKKPEPEQNELLAPHEQSNRMDTGTAGAAGRGDKGVEAVGAIHRPAKRSRKGQSIKERR